jgi:hypothetical protein
MRRRVAFMRTGAAKTDLPKRLIGLFRIVCALFEAHLKNPR